MKKLLTLIFIAGTYLCSAQQAFYDVTPGNGNGIRFWQQDNTYKIHMGTGSEYFYGPVTDYSIKTNMSIGTPGRGWTWGNPGLTPIAALNTLGNMQIAGTFTSSNLLANVTLNNPGLTVSGNSSSSTTADIFITRSSSSTNAGNAPAIQFSDLGSGSHNIIQSSSSGLQFHNFYAGSGWIERMRISSNGYVGIGTTVPNSKLDLGTGYGSSGVKLLIYNDNSSSELAGTKCGFYMDNFRPNNLNLVFPEASAYPGLFTISAKNTSGTTLNPYFSVVGLTGNVGIGTTSPQSKLEVHGTAAIGQYTDGTAVIDAFNSYAYFGCNTPTNGLAIGPTGNVGIGNSNPDAKLTVTGLVHAQEVKVTVAAPGPDYVFEKDYPLTSLEEIKNYIDQNKHLPEVPSAKEMEKNGVQLGEMNMLLLKKIEELTLHLIELKKENTELKEYKNQIDQIRMDLNKLMNTSK